MTHLPVRLFLCGLLLGTGAACLGDDRVNEARGFDADPWVAVSDDALGAQRGGFEVASGLTVSFGMMRMVTLNGDLVNSTSFSLPDVSRITPEQARSASAAMAEAGLVQVGDGNRVPVGTLAQVPAGTIIQNSLNNQNIQTLTVINTGVNSQALFKAINIQSVLSDALLGALAVR
jgi:hypothetical protein